MAAVPSNADLLRNYPANIPGATRNVIPDPAVPPGEEVVGLPLAIFRPVLNEQGVLADAVKVYVGPPLRDDGTTDGDYVSIALWLNGVELEHRQIPEPERNDPTEFTLFQTLLLDNRNNNLYYKVYRLSGSPANSEPLWVLYSAQLPGGNNVPGNDEHPLLTVTLPPELGEPPFIGKDDVDAGVPLTLDYPYAKPYDVINLQLRNERFSFIVQPGDARPFVAIADRAMFEWAGGIHPAFPFSFTVVDQLNNPTHQRRWSAEVTADVDVSRIMLDVPILREDLADNSDDPTIIDRDKLLGGPLSIVVVPRPPLYAVGDTVEGRYITTPPETMVPFSGTIEAEFGLYKPCIMQVPNNRIISGNQVRVSYSLIRGGTPVGLSKTASAQVIGDGLINLRAPTVKQASGSVLNPIAARDKLTVVIPHYTGMDSAHRVFVTWTGTPSEGSHSTLPVDVGTVGEKDIEIPNSVVAFNLGKQVTVTYSVSINGGPPQASDPLTVNVQTIPDQSTDLPIPTIGGATGNELDVSRLDANSQLVVDPWPLQLSGQGVWLAYDGELASGGRETRTVWEGQPHSAASGLVVAAPVDWLKTLKDGSELIVTFKVNFDKVANAATAVRFRVRRYTVRAAAPLALAFMNGPYAVAPMGQVKTIRMNLRNLAGTPVVGGDISLTLPPQFKYADGGTGVRVFKTGLDGVAVVTGVRANAETNGYKLVASAGSMTVDADLIITAQSPLGTFDCPEAHRAVISPDGLKLYVLGYRYLRVVDTNSMAVVATIDHAQGANEHHISISSDGERVYEAAAETDPEGSSHVIDTNTNTIIRRIPNPDERGFTGLAVSSHNGQVFTGYHYGVQVMDSEVLSILRDIEMPYGVGNMATSPDGKRLYVSIAGGIICVVDTVSYEVIKNIQTPLNKSRSGVTPDNAFVYVFEPSAQTLVVINAATESIEKSIPISTEATDIAFSPDGGHAYLSHFSRDLTVIDTKNHRVIEVIRRNVRPSGIAVSPDSTRVFICQSTSIEVITGR